MVVVMFTDRSIDRSMKLFQAHIKVTTSLIGEILVEKKNKKRQVNQLKVSCQKRALNTASIILYESHGRLD